MMYGVVIMVSASDKLKALLMLPHNVVPTPWAVVHLIQAGVHHEWHATAQRIDEAENSKTP